MTKLKTLDIEAGSVDILLGDLRSVTKALYAILDAAPKTGEKGKEIRNAINDAGKGLEQVSGLFYEFLRANPIYCFVCGARLADTDSGSMCSACMSAYCAECGKPLTDDEKASKTCDACYEAAMKERNEKNA